MYCIVFAARASNELMDIGVFLDSREVNAIGGDSARNRFTLKGGYCVLSQYRRDEVVECSSFHRS